MKRVLFITSALVAAVLSMPSAGMSIFNPTTVIVIDHGATSWSEGSGAGFGNEGASGGTDGSDNPSNGNGASAPPGATAVSTTAGGPTESLGGVVITGKRIINLETVVVSDVSFTRLGNQFDPPALKQYNFDSRDQGITVPQDKVPNPADEKAKCVANCAAIQTVEASICDSRAANILEGGTAIGGGAYMARYIPRVGKYIPKDWPEKIYNGAQKAAITYALICKGEASGRYSNCIHGDCKA